MDLTSILNAVAPLLSALALVYIAVSTRRKNDSDAALAISTAAEKTVALREKDVEKLENRISILEEYITYRNEWREDHPNPESPLSLEEFTKRKAPD